MDKWSNNYVIESSQNIYDLMDKDETIIDNSNDYGPITTIESFNSILNDMNQDSFFNEINIKFDEEKVTPRNSFYELESSNTEEESFLKLVFHRIFFTIILVVLVLSFILVFISIIAVILEVGISFYSVIMMNYVFFVSSIVSYTMAPIYQSLSGDWLNFIFSFTQVILASPLIGFYIFYILKSVISLASFISEIPSVIKHIFFLIYDYYKEFFVEIISDFCDPDFDLDFDCIDFQAVSIIFLISLGFIILASAFAYVEFCFDKTIIIFGVICYIINTIQIIILVLPSYVYFIQCLLSIKSKENKFVKFIIEKMNIINDKFEEKSDSNKKHERVIDDRYIEQKNTGINKFSKLANKLLPLIMANDYISLYSYSKTIAFDRHKRRSKVAFMYIFFFLNLAVISYDIYVLKKNFSNYFLASVIIRFIFIPLFSYYNITIIIFNRSKDASLNVVLIISSVFTALIAIVIIFGFQFTDFYQSKYRISNLEYYPINNNITIANKEMIDHPICDYKIYDVSAFDAFGYALGGYDIKRNKEVFDNQMKIFFNENYSSHISYKINELDEHFLFIEYYDSLINTHIFGFRGYNSGPEVAFQIELLAMHYIIPFFEDIVPFYELINDNWLRFYTDFLNSFGLNFFENDNLMVKYVNSIIDVYKKVNLTEDDRVLFAGINSGGVIAKIVGTLLHRKSISFISFPIDNDLYHLIFDFSLSYLSLVTNVYNVEGFFSDQEPRFATNIGIELPVFNSKRFCTSGICEINSKTDNVYRTFCTMSEICGKGNRFNYYCENVIGKNDIETIRESLKESD